jgi:hypothetical protein
MMELLHGTYLLLLEGAAQSLLHFAIFLPWGLICSLCTSHVSKTPTPSTSPLP